MKTNLTIKALLILVMMLFLKTQLYAVRMVDDGLDFSNYEKNESIHFWFKLEEYKTTDVINMTVYWDTKRVLIKDSLTKFNKDSSFTGFKNGWNTVCIENLPNGITYRLVIRMNDIESFLDIPVFRQEGKDEKSIAGVTANPTENDLTLLWLYNVDSHHNEFNLVFSTNPDFKKPILFEKNLNSTIMDYHQIHSELIDYQDFDLDIKELRGKVVYYKIFALFSHYKDTVEEVGSFTIPFSFGINSIANMHIEIFPNPCAEYIICTSNNAGNVEIYDTRGSLLVSQPVKVGRNYISSVNLDLGNYTLVFKNQDGLQVVKKISKML